MLLYHYRANIQVLRNFIMNLSFSPSLMSSLFQLLASSLSLSSLSLICASTFLSYSQSLDSVCSKSGHAFTIFQNAFFSLLATRAQVSLLLLPVNEINSVFPTGLVRQINCLLIIFFIIFLVQEKLCEIYHLGFLGETARSKVKQVKICVLLFVCVNCCRDRNAEG